MKTKAHEWVQHIIDMLFQADDRRIAAAVQHLNMQNSEIKKQNFHGFIHNGIRFIDPRFEQIKVSLAKRPLPTLALQLANDLRIFDADRNQVEEDKTRIRQALVPLMVNSIDKQDMRDSLPDCVANLVPEFAKMHRQRENITTHIRSDKFAMKAYEKALPLMEQYSVAALIY
jgi:hypothetical protein